MNYYFKYLRSNFIYVSVYIVAALISIGIVTSYNMKLKIDALTENRAFYDTMYIHFSRQYMDIIRAWDVGIRGYAIMKDTAYLAAYTSNPLRYRVSAAIIDSVLKIRRYSFEEKVRSSLEGLKNYEPYILEMERLVRQDSMEQFKKLLLEDRGKTLWLLYHPAWEAVAEYETKKIKEAEADLQLAFTLNRGFQLSLLIIGIPLLIWLVRKLQRDALNRRNLLQKLDDTNRAELFDDGNVHVELTPESVIGNVTKNMKQAEAFIRAIAEGNYNATWKGLTPENAALNTTNVVGELLQLKDKLARVSREEERRRWAAEGVTQFNELLRKHQHDLKELSVHVLSFLVRYTDSLQGGIFIAKQSPGAEKVLEMSACYAYERIKAMQRQIQPGEGLIGQVYLEKETLHIARIPADYTAISAGMGSVKPKELIIIPLKTNDLVEGVIELATLQTYDNETVAFLERTCEFLASAIASQKNAEQNRLLLEQLKLQTETMRVQEEELRQNMEELQATHEALHRKVSENKESKLPGSTH
ncbi:GAF domain-containing protein [Rhodoflexus caldus]|uniref:GAF domain-containing protein n=1 Tax=Rhodoflexus caldus TaxID=2891236 RepID=UPI00202A7E53|nr:GAF domain-containing protein [Rhodoflexus caldus]